MPWSAFPARGVRELSSRFPAASGGGIHSLSLGLLRRGPALRFTVGLLKSSLASSPPTRDSIVTLRELTEENVVRVCRLEVKPEQRGYVAPNAISIAQAYVSAYAWTRAIYAGDVPVGFVMLRDDPDTPRYYVWRYMVGAEYQKLDFGRRAMEQVIAYVRTRPSATELTLSYVPGEAGPRDFYARFGFEETGRKHGGEIEMRLAL